MAVVSSGPLSLQTKALVAKCLRCEVSVWACEEQALNADHDIARQSAKNPTRNKLVNRIVALRILRSWHELLRFRLKTCNPVKLERRKLSKVSKSERWEFLVERQKHTLTETSKKCKDSSKALRAHTHLQSKKCWHQLGSRLAVFSARLAQKPAANWLCVCVRHGFLQTQHSLTWLSHCRLNCSTSAYCCAFHAIVS